MSATVAGDETLGSDLRELERLALARAALPTLLWRTFVLRRRARLQLGQPLPRDARHALGHYLGAIRGVLRFRIYESLFGLWHAFHLPLCFLLFGAAGVHVVAVHLY